MFGEVSIAIQTLCSILERAAPMEESETLFVVTVNVLTVLLRSYPDEIWLHLRSSDTIFPLDKASTTPVWGSRTTSANKSILVQDKIKGSYQRTLACLEMVQGLVLQAQWLADRDSVEAVKVKAPVLKRAMQWIAGSVWSSYTSWRYQDLRQKYEMGSRLASVLTDLLHEADLKSRSSLNTAVELVLQILLIRPGQAEMSAFMSIINSGATILTSLQQLGRTADCVVVEACILNHLQLSNRLLQISRRIVKTGPTYLERLYFAHSNEPLFRALLPDASLDSIYILSAYVVTSENPQIATEAAGVLTKLCRLAADWGSPSERPSFLSHLGSIRDTESFLRKLLQLAGDPFVESTLQLATWRLLSAIAAHQPGFASILITGKQAVALVEASSSSDGEDSSTAASLALDVVRGWDEAWLVQPAILSASLTFLHAIWQNYITSSPILQQKRKESHIWSALLDIASRPLKVEAGPPREATSELDYAYRKHAQAAAVALYAVDMSYSSSSSPDSEGISTKTFIDFVGHSSQFEKWCQNAASCNIDLQRLEQTRSHLEAIVSTDSLDRYTHTQQLDSAPYGTDFYYDSNLLSKRLVGWISTSSTDLEAMRGAWANIREMNILWSMADGEAASLKSTVSCLQEILSRVPSSAQSCVAIRATCAALQGEFVMGSDSSALAEVRYDRSLRLLEVLVEYLARSGFHVETDFKMSLVSFLAGILSNETFTLEAGIRKSGVQYATSAFRLVNFTFKLKSEQLARSVVLKSTTPSNGSEPVETCLHACINACDFLITIAKEAAITEEVSQDMEWAVTALCEILSTPLAPSPSVWLAYCSVKDFFRHALDLVTSSSFDNSNIPFVRALLELLLAMAKHPLAAEKLALDGVVFSICNNAMTSLLEAGAVGSREDANSDSRVSSLLHGLWRLFLCIVTQLAQHLGTSIPFMDQEVSTFVQMYRSQLLSSIQWTPDRTLTISDIKEHRAVLTLMAVCIRSTRQAEHLQASMQDLIQSMLRFLPQLVYLLQHPNLLVSLVESSIPAEISWLAADSGRADGVDLSELHSHPVVATLTQEVFSLCWVTVSMLISFTDAFAVLSRDRVDWPRDRIVISAVSFQYRGCQAHRC